MLYLFLDESGDLGFDFVQKKPSEHFVVTILAIKGDENRKKLAKAVARTLRKKLNPKNKVKAPQELKGMDTSLQVKQYFIRQADSVDFSLYTVVIPKRKLFFKLAENKGKVYDFITQILLKFIPLEEANQKVILTLDRSKNKHAVKEFNEHTAKHLRDRLSQKVPLKIYHENSQELNELQAVDLFAWGIFRKHEKKDMEWYRLFQGHIRVEEILHLNENEPVSSNVLSCGQPMEGNT
jgi:hypothetical protein